MTFDGDSARWEMCNSRKPDDLCLSLTCVIFSSHSADAGEVS